MLQHHSTGSWTQIFVYAPQEQYRRLQIYPEYGKLSDVFVAEFQTHSAIVVVPLKCIRTSSTTSIQPCVAQRTIFQPLLLLSSARSAHAVRHSRDSCENIALQYRARIVTYMSFCSKDIDYQRVNCT
jgi:hypothetical protein